MAKILFWEINALPNRKYKDELFRFIFRDKKDLLQLYNAMNNSSYQNPEKLEINTLEDVLYIKMKNDLSFVIGSTLNLYEHQSTPNINMPLRGFEYFSELFKIMAAERKWDLYGNKRIKIPTPQFVVFYIGKADMEERSVLKLSDSFENKDVKGCLECEALVVNINSGYNPELMEKCKPLKDYSLFVAEVNRRLGQGLGSRKAYELAIDFCMDNDILVDILRKHRGEVIRMLMTTHNVKWYTKLMKENATKEGREEGREQGREEERKAWVAVVKEKDDILKEKEDALKAQEALIAQLQDQLKTGNRHSVL